MISFKWRRFPKDLILMSIRWYVAYSLSYRDIEELVLERHVNVDHSTLNRWVIHFHHCWKMNFERITNEP